MEDCPLSASKTKTRKPSKEPKVTDRQWAYAEAYLELGDKKAAAKEAGFKAWETNFCHIHKQRGTQHAMMKLAKDRREHLPVTQDYIMASLHEVAERAMQARPVRDSRGNQVFQRDNDGNKVAALFTFDARGAISALTKMGEAIAMFQPKPEDKADEEQAQRDRAIQSELRRIAEAVERRPSVQSAPIIGDERDERARSGGEKRLN